MKSFLIIIGCLLLLSKAHASMVGSGDVELGVSRDNDKANAGMGMRYNVEINTPESQSLITSRLQLGSDSGRSLIATAAHEYQYENSFVDSELNHSIRLFSPRLSWKTYANNRFEFKNEVDEDTGSVDTDYSNAEESWSITTGPTFKYEQGRWFHTQLTTEISKEYSHQTYTDETLVDVKVGKSTSKVSELILNYNYLCRKRDDKLIDDFCRNQVSLAFNSTKSNFGYSLEYGTSRDEDTRTDIYSISNYMNLNSTSVFSLSVYQLIDRIGLADELTTLKDESTISTRQGRLAKYLYNWGRTQLEINARRIKVESELATTISDDAAIYYDFRLSSWLCSACRLSSAYEYSKFDNDNEQNILSIGLKKSNSKSMSSEISFRRTERVDQDILWSINFLISYRSKATRLADR